MNLHVIIGADDYLVGETAKKTIGDGVGLEVIDSLNSTNADAQLDDIRQAEASFSTPPFLDPRKVTWWRNVHFLPGGKASKEVTDRLAEFVERLVAADLPENQHFILSGPHLLSTSKLAKALAAKAEVVTFSTGKPYEEERNAVVRAVDLAGEVGFRFETGAAERFVATVGTDVRSLMSEVCKLRDYLGEGVATASVADVAAITSAGAKVEPVPWDVTDAIGARKLGAALTAMNRFAGDSGFAIMMTNIIEKLFRQLIDVKRGVAEGMTPYARRKFEGFVAGWGLNELRVARARFVNLREKLVSGTTAGDDLLIAEVVRACRKG